jgi:ribosomal-protein-alanine N-acetyltransferase
MNIQIRKMELADIPSVLAIDQASFTLPWPESSYRYEVLSNRVARCLVAEDQQHQIVGMIVSWILTDELHIATFATHAGRRREGIGTLLLRKALTDASHSGARRAYLEVRESNLVAQAVYGKFGFKVSGRRPRYYRDNNEDAILMTLGAVEMK